MMIFDNIKEAATALGWPRPPEDAPQAPVEALEQGLAGVLSFCPYEDHYRSSLGWVDAMDQAWVITREGWHPVRASYSWRSTDRHEPDVERQGETVAEAIARLRSPIMGVAVYSRVHDDFHPSDNGEGWTLYLPEPVKDDRLRKIRRRVEDRLRKAPAETILAVAALLEVKLD